MRLRVFLALAILATSAMPASAQGLTMTIFGDDKCPENAICVRAPERDRYRIPKQFRERVQTPDSQSWSARSQSTLDTGKTGIGSCSAVGSGGWSGCWLQEMKKAREEAKADAPK